MKKIFLFLLFSSFLFAQENSNKSLVELKLEAHSVQGIAQSELNLIQHSVSGIRYQATSLQPSASRKNPGLAIIYSLLLPGMGELYAGGYESGKYFTIADGVLWGVFIGFDTYGNWKMDNYKSFARSNGGVNTDGKDADFFANIGTYISVDEYNRVQDLNRDYNLTYNSEKYYWRWTSEAQRKEYKQMWTSSESAFNNVRFAVGALILNRLISAINAVRLVSAYNKNLTVETSWNMSVGVNNQPTLPTSITFNFVKSF